MSSESSKSPSDAAGAANSEGPDTSTQPPTPKTIRWSECIELGYITDDKASAAGGAANNVDASNGGEAPESSSSCFKCGKSGATAKCAKCATVSYCSRDCQLADWKKGSGGGHKYCCAAYKRVGTAMVLTTAEDKCTARESVLTRIRFYACSYAVHKAHNLGKGFLFLQSPSTLAELSLPIPKLPNGTMMPGIRSVLLHYLTMGEFDQEVCRDDFEMTSVRKSLTKVVEEYDDKEEVAVLMRFRCGHVAVGVAPLVPDYGVCKSLGKEYFGEGMEGALQLNLDDV
mmetsp:Transcript_19441/g.55938  ORF Transcript_19441/g.55938 Transcript_19441/m.55938 type:complete len:285 (+) Transcript_19441:33-887(+)